jgi:hypothetical protein
MNKGCAYCGKGRDKRHGGKQWFLVGYIPTREVIKLCSLEHLIRVDDLYREACRVLEA